MLLQETTSSLPNVENGLELGRFVPPEFVRVINGNEIARTFSPLIDF